MKFPPLSEIRHIVVYVLGVIAGVISLGLLHGTALVVAGAVITVATGVGLYKLPPTSPTPLVSADKPAG